MWEVEATDQWRAWYENLSERELEAVNAAVDLLQEKGPNLKRPLVGEIVGSRVSNMKELRPLGTSIRILFVFDPRRAAILLVGGDKAARGWNDWYSGAIAEAEVLYETYIEELREEGLVE